MAEMKAADFAFDLIETVLGKSKNGIEDLCNKFGIDYTNDGLGNYRVREFAEEFEPLLKAIVQRFYDEWDEDGRKFRLGDVVEIHREAFVDTTDVREFEARGQLGIITSLEGHNRYLVDVDYVGEIGVWEEELTHAVQRQP